MESVRCLLDELHWVLIAHRDANRGHEACITGFMWQYRVEEIRCDSRESWSTQICCSEIGYSAQYLRQVYYWPLLAFAVEFSHESRSYGKWIPQSQLWQCASCSGCWHGTHLIRPWSWSKWEFLGRVKNGVDPQYCTVWEGFSISLL